MDTHTAMIIMTLISQTQAQLLHIQLMVLLMLPLMLLMELTLMTTHLTMVSGGSTTRLLTHMLLLTKLMLPQ